MGHRDLAATQIYAEVQQEHLRAAVCRLVPLVTPELPKMSPEIVTCAALEGGESLSC